MFGLHKLYSKQSLLRFLWKKAHRLEKSTPTPLVALQTNMSYACRLPYVYNIQQKIIKQPKIYQK